MRNTSGFTDGRIHVTLCEGAYDLKTFSLVEQSLYTTLLDRYTMGCDLIGLETGFDWKALGNGVGLELSDEFHAVYRDFCRRITIDVLSDDVEFTEELRPWRPEQTREFVEAALA